MSIPPPSFLLVCLLFPSPLETPHTPLSPTLQRKKEKHAELPHPPRGITRHTPPLSLLYSTLSGLYSESSCSVLSCLFCHSLDGGSESEVYAWADRLDWMPAPAVSACLSLSLSVFESFQRTTLLLPGAPPFVFRSGAPNALPPRPTPASSCFPLRDSIPPPPSTTPPRTQSPPTSSGSGPLQVLSPRVAHPPPPFRSPYTRPPPVAAACYATRHPPACALGELFSFGTPDADYPHPRDQSPGIVFGPPSNPSLSLPRHVSPLVSFV